MGQVITLTLTLCVRVTDIRRRHCANVVRPGRCVRGGRDVLER